MITPFDIGWLAGLLEGEGCFDLQKDRHPRVRVQLTDKDVVAKFALMLFEPIHESEHGGLGTKRIYHCSIQGSKAIGLIMTLYPLMGLRRQEKIREVILKWKLVPKLNRVIQRAWRSAEFEKLATALCS